MRVITRPPRPAASTRSRSSAPAARSGAAPRGNVPAMLHLAAQLHQDDHLDEAATVYERCLEAAPDDPTTLKLFGLLEHQRSRHDRAAELLQRAKAIRPGDAEVLRLLGETYRSLARFDEAIQHFRDALDVSDDDADTLCHLGHAYLVAGKPRQAEVCYRRAARILPNDAQIHLWLGSALLQQDKASAAASALSRGAALAPDDASISYLHAVATATAPAAAPDAYVRQLFDEYAETFDRALVALLDYDVPRKLRELFDACADGGATDLAIADLGCGTGLCGAAFHDRAATLEGVDLAPRMIERARERGIYDDLHVSELRRFLSDATATYDVLTAADVLIYTGDLDDTMRAAFAALRPGGSFLFSTEGGADVDAPCVLQSTGRYAHHEEAVRDAARTAGFAVTAVRNTTIRTDRGRDLPGQLWMLTRPA